MRLALDFWLSPDGTITTELWTLARAPETTIVVWSLVAHGAPGSWEPSIACWSTLGIGAVADAELSAGLRSRGFASREARSETVSAFERLAREEGTDVRIVDLAGTATQLAASLPLLERLAFSQERTALCFVTGVGQAFAAARIVLRKAAKRAGARFTQAAEGDAERTLAPTTSVPICPRLLVRRRRDGVRVLHRCTHETFALRDATTNDPAVLLEAAAEALGLDHPAGAAFVAQRAKLALDRARATVPAFRDAGSFETLPVVTPAEWAARFWETTSLRPDRAGLAGRTDLSRSSSAGTSSGVSRPHVVEQHVAEDRCAAEHGHWERVTPWRVAVVNRPTNLFAVDAAYDRFRLRRTSRDLRATPGLNPTQIPSFRWDRLARAIEAFAPTALGGDAQYLLGLTDHLTRARLPSLRQLIVSNHVSWAFQRRDLEAHFGLATTSLYHAGETSMIGTSCRHGRWHLLETYGSYEAFARGVPASPGERGLLAASLFDGAVRPLLRYALGDIVRLSEASCPCGRTGRSVVLDGRVAFTFLDGRGAFVTARQVDLALASAEGVRHLAVHRTAAGVILRYVGAPSAVLPAEALADTLGLAVRVERVEALPLAAAAGKLGLFVIEPSFALSEAAFLSAQARPITFSGAPA